MRCVADCWLSCLLVEALRYCINSLFARCVQKLEEKRQVDAQIKYVKGQLDRFKDVAVSLGAKLRNVHLTVDAPSVIPYEIRCSVEAPPTAPNVPVSPRRASLMRGASVRSPSGLAKSPLQSPNSARRQSSLRIDTVADGGVVGLQSPLVSSKAQPVTVTLPPVPQASPTAARPVKIIDTTAVNGTARCMWGTVSWGTRVH